MLHQAGGQAGGAAGAGGGGAAEGVLAASSAAGGSGQNTIRQILDNQDFQTLCDAIVNDCSKFDNFSIVNCLYAVAALGESCTFNSAVHFIIYFLQKVRLYSGQES